ncbi:MAG: TPM domain-containing protein [Spirochaetes bacterium]|jgi:uncharacterized protein|nr:TPM domain-containing protein [Spirochaetota bacterium]
MCFHKSYRQLLILFFFLLLLIPTSGYAAKTRIYDAGSLLSDDEKAEIEKTLERVSTDYDTDLFILTSQSLGGITPKRHAEDFFWGNGHGTRDDSGVVLVIDMGERDVWIATFGRAIQTFENDIQKIISDITPDLTNANYAESFRKFSQQMEKPLQEITVPTFKDEIIKMSKQWPPYAIALALSLIITIGLSLNFRGKKLVTNKTYEVKDSFVLSESLDTYLRTTTTRSKISSSSGSSSGGRSSGGGGGKF